MEKQKFSNFCIPNKSKRFIMSDIQDKKLQNIEGIARQDAIDSPYRFPYGIIDGWRVNESYKNLLLKMKINDITNDESVTMIQATEDWDAEDKKKTQIIQICEWENQEQDMDVDADQDDDDLHAIYTWRTIKLPIETIAQKLGQTAVEVSRTIRNYKEMVRSQLKSNSKRAAKGRRKIDDDGLEEIKEFWIGKIHRSICVDDVNKAVWGSEEIKRSSTNPKIMRVTKRQPKMSYRTSNTKHPKNSQRGL